MKTITTLLCAAALALPTAAQADDGETKVDISASLTGATDYVWRGVSQSNEKPAVFAAVNVNYGGFYAGAGTENVDFAGINQEYDLWGGYVFDLGGVKLDLGAVRYGYVDAPANIDTLEVKAGVSGKVGKVGLGLTGYHTWDYFGTGNDATYVEAKASYAVTDKLSLSGAFGHQDIEALPDYNTWNVGASYKVLPGASVDVRYHDTDDSNGVLFGDLGDARVVGSFTVSF